MNLISQDGLIMLADVKEGYMHEETDNDAVTKALMRRGYNLNRLDESDPYLQELIEKHKKYQFIVKDEIMGEYRDIKKAKAVVREFSKNVNKDVTMYLVKEVDNGNNTGTL